MRIFLTPTNSIDLEKEIFTQRLPTVANDKPHAFSSIVTVNEVLVAMAQTLDCDPSGLGLHFAGRWLKGERSLAEEGVCDLSTVHVLGRVLGGMQATPDIQVRFLHSEVWQDAPS